RNQRAHNLAPFHVWPPVADSDLLTTERKFGRFVRTDAVFLRGDRDDQRDEGRENKERSIQFHFHVSLKIMLSCVDVESLCFDLIYAYPIKMRLSNGFIVTENCAAGSE